MIHPTPKQDKIVEASNWPTIREAFKEYEETFVLLHPFLRIRPGCAIKFETGNWPTKEQINRCTDKISWAEIIEEAGLNDINELDRLLAYLHCARKTADRTAWQKLMQVVDRNLYSVPQVDYLPEILLNDILKAIKALGYNQVAVFSEFIGFEKSVYDIGEVILQQEHPFRFQARYATPDKKLLLATDFDQRFTYLSSTTEVVGELVEAVDLEGFYCTEATRPDWSYTEQTENVIDWQSPERKRNYA